MPIATIATSADCGADRKKSAKEKTPTRRSARYVCPAGTYVAGIVLSRWDNTMRKTIWKRKDANDQRRKCHINFCLEKQGNGTKTMHQKCSWIDRIQNRIDRQDGSDNCSGIFDLVMLPEFLRLVDYQIKTES